ncbi:hypothetical protein V6Z72_13320 [Cereibacter sphaeroides]|uniref:hypothetical protein n=1 Tax=Cereibacter sphaeroides TaxID=1063 RepID=UPI0039907459
MFSLKDNSPPPDAQRVRSVADLPPHRAPARYRIRQADGSTRDALLSKRRRQVLDLLRRGPVFAASPLRISDAVRELRTDFGVDIHTEMYRGDRASGAGDYGVYYLRSALTTTADVGDQYNG